MMIHAFLEICSVDKTIFKLIVTNQSVTERSLPEFTVVSTTWRRGKKGKVFPYLLPSVGPGADPGVQAVSSQVTVSYSPGGRLPLFSARSAVTFPAEERHRSSADSGR